MTGIWGFACRTAGAFDEPGIAETDKRDCEYQVYRGVYQSVERKSWHYVWKSRDNGRRACTQILCFRPSGCKKTETVKKEGQAVSNRVKVKVVKNKVAPPFKEAMTEIVFGQGIDIYGEIVHLEQTVKSFPNVVRGLPCRMESSARDVMDQMEQNSI